MKFILPILLIACYHFPIEYTAHNLPVPITCVKCDSIPDSSFSFLAIRARELDDSIALIRKQNKWLDSFNHTLDTVHWAPYYNKLKRQKQVTN